MTICLYCFYLSLVLHAQRWRNTANNREKSKKRNRESTPGLLESLSDAVGAGRGLQEAMLEQGRNTPGVLGKLLTETLESSHASSFDAALSAFASKTRSSQVQRVVVLIDTAIQQDAPLQNILSDLAMDYERLNDLMNKGNQNLQVEES